MGFFSLIFVNFDAFANVYVAFGREDNTFRVVVWRNSVRKGRMFFATVSFLLVFVIIMYYSENACMLSCDKDLETF